jgi:hypothetical protein
MKPDKLKVVVRTEHTLISTRLEIEGQQAFAVLYVYGPKGTNEVVGEERMELDVQFLQKINELEYLYKKQVELPDPRKN